MEVRCNEDITPPCVGALRRCVSECSEEFRAGSGNRVLDCYPAIVAILEAVIEQIYALQERYRAVGEGTPEDREVVRRRELVEEDEVTGRHGPIGRVEDLH